MIDQDLIKVGQKLTTGDTKMYDIPLTKKIESLEIDLAIKAFQLKGGVIQDCNHIKDVKHVTSPDSIASFSSQSYKGAKD